jgi:hypothetical protein
MLAIKVGTTLYPVRPAAEKCRNLAYATRGRAQETGEVSIVVALERLLRPPSCIGAQQSALRWFTDVSPRKQGSAQGEVQSDTARTAAPPKESSELSVIETDPTLQNLGPNTIP